MFSRISRSNLTIRMTNEVEIMSELRKHREKHGCVDVSRVDLRQRQLDSDLQQVSCRVSMLLLVREDNAI